ncbi:eukaryotic translation initiation factor [Apiospora arundinis]
MATPKKRVTSGASNSGANQGSPGVSHITAAMGSTTLQEDPNSLKVVGKRVDLPIEAYAKDVENSPFTARPAGNEPGNEYRGSASINAFEVTATPKMDVYMYSVSVKDKTNPPRGLIKELWNSNTVQRAINPDPKKNPINWIFNGYNLAWSYPKMKSDQEIKVTLDPGSKKETVFTLVIKYTRLIPMSPLRDYLNGGKNACTSDVVMCLNFLDHVLRQTPSTTHQLIGKNFFGQTPGPPKDIDGYLEVIKGSFASIRVGRDRNKEKGRGLIVNVDVANTVFWQPLILYDTVYTMVKKHFNLPEARVPEYLLPSRGSEGMIEPEAFQFLRRLRGVKFQVIIPKKSNEAPSRKTHTIERFHFDETKDGGANAMNVTFVKKDKDGKKTGEVTVLQHFKDFHGYEINRKMCPLVETKRHDYFPLEVCQILPLQRYRYKLVFEQTNTMIGYSASPPRDRIRDINDAVRNLRWATDSNLGAFGLRINDIMLNPKLRLLGQPFLRYAQEDAFPPGEVKNLIDKKFLSHVETEGAAFVNLTDCSDKVKNDIWFRINDAFTYHANTKKKNILGKPVFKTMKRIEQLGEKHNYSIVFVLINERSTDKYQHIKKFLDCKAKVPSQVVVLSKARKLLGKRDGYWSNICLKVNAKLGGTNFISLPRKDTQLDSFAKDTMMVGLDVSHAAPGSNEQSMAAMSASLDKYTAYYGGSCQTNGERNEIVEYPEMKSLLEDLLKHWVSKTDPKQPRAPAKLYFFRDGVSEGQFQHVIDTEVQAIKKVFTDNEYAKPKITVIVATKRHHIRAFLDSKNPGPGILVEDVATHPQHWDFYLYSHRAILGTSRPVHYHVIMDEIGHTKASLTNLIYQQCYQYSRCHTPVSLHPAIYYAHRISLRARSHVADKKEPGDDRIKVMPIGDLRNSMWFA